MMESLTLRLVYGQGRRRADWELQAVKRRKESFRFCQADPWNENQTPIERTCEKPTLEAVPSDGQDLEASPIDHHRGDAHVSQQGNDTANLEDQAVRWETAEGAGIEQLQGDVPEIPIAGFQELGREFINR